MIRAKASAIIRVAVLAVLISCGGDATQPPPPISKVAVTTPSATMLLGESTQLAASASLANGQVVSDVEFTWLSDAPTVATVDATGLVTAKNPGNALIVAKTGSVTGAVVITVRPVTADPLSLMIDTVRVAWNMPAMGAAVVTLDGGVVDIGVAGTRRATGGLAVTSDDLWHIGSNLKAMTSLLAAVAVSQDRIQWTTTIAQAFPELTNIRAEYAGVTLRELLSHQSGFQRDPNQAAFGTGSPTAQRAQQVAWAVQQPPAVARGTYLYSNLAFLMAGSMLERAFGSSYEALIPANIYAPLGVTDAGWGPQAGLGSVTQPVAHTWVNGAWMVREAHDNPPAAAPAGTAHMSLTSWGRLIREVLRIEAGTSTVAPALIAQQTTSPAVTVSSNTTYGMGWYITTSTSGGGKILYHDGTNGGNHSLAVIDPVNKVAFLATTNGFDVSGRSWDALNALINRVEEFYSLSAK